MLIETYTTLAPNEVIARLPKFLNIDQEVCRSTHTYEGQPTGQLKNMKVNYRVT